MAVVANRYRFFYHKPPQDTLGILAFDAAKTMCRLLSLYKSLSDEEIMKLHGETLKSKGVVYLNSKQECFLLNLACAEHLEDLNLAATTVSRLGQKCSDHVLNRFDLVYEDLKVGIIDIRKLEFGTRNIQKIIEKMEKLVSATGNLHAAMECLAGMEASEKKMQGLKTINPKHCGYRVKMDNFYEKIAFERKQVRHYKEVSLWNQTFDKTVRLMARIVCIVYARICSVFGPYISGLPCFRKNKFSSVFSRPENCYCLLEHRELYRTNFFLIDQNEKSTQKRETKSGPIPKSKKSGLIRFRNSPLPFDDEGLGCTAEQSGCDSEIVRNNRVLRMASPSTVGGSGLSLRYADVIIFAERCLHTPATIGEDAREALYEMLPERLKTKVRAKLKRHWLKGDESEDGGDGHSLADGWREAVEELMEWLSPVAHDTVRWQAERNLEKQKYDTKPTVLLLQTLHYSDLEKVEAAIVEVLVGLSCIYRYEKRQRRRESWRH